MKFFTAGDVLDHAKVAPKDPLTIERNTPVTEALTLMLRNDFDQLPVMDGETVAGAVTFKSLCRLAKSVPRANLQEMTVRGGLVTPTYVASGHDIFELFETFAVEEFVLVGDEDHLEGIITRYDVFYFLKEQFEPFIMIGEIERSLRTLFQRHFHNLEQRLQETFQPRAEHDASYTIPESIDHLNFEEYKRLIVGNLDDLPEEVQQDREFVLELLEGVRQNRNALFHFRASADEIDREIIEVAHSYFTELVE